MVKEKDLIEKLEERKPGLKKILDEFKVVEDVLENNIKKCNRMEQVGVWDYTSDKPAPEFRQFNVSGYLPRNTNEHPDEYQKRLSITPIFTETDGILQARVGSMFKKPPKLTAPEELEHLFENEATMHGGSFLDVLAKVFTKTQIQGFGGILVDRRPTNPNVKSKLDQKVSKAGQAVLAYYCAPEILDWEMGSNGLEWVKLRESKVEKGSWDTEPVMVDEYRIVDKENIRVYQVRHKDNGKELVDLGAVKHDAKNRNDEPIVPFFMFNPYPDDQGIGRSILRPCAEADIAAIRVLSELSWILHMMVPILTLTTHRTDTDVGTMGFGASRFIVLQALANGPSEELKFTQLDPTAVDKLTVQYDKLTARAREQADRLNIGTIAGHQEVSGISKAWTFKTTEERILFLFGSHMQNQFNKILDLVARYSNVEYDKVTISFPKNYDIQGNTDTLAQAERALSICNQYDLKESATIFLERLMIEMLENPADEHWEKIKEEIQEKVQNGEIPLNMLNAPEATSSTFDGKTNFSTDRRKADLRQEGLKPDDVSQKRKQGKNAFGEGKDERSTSDKQSDQDRGKKRN